MASSRTKREQRAQRQTHSRREIATSLLALSRAVEKLDGIRQAPRFVEDFVEEAADEKLNLLN